MLLTIFIIILSIVLILVLYNLYKLINFNHQLKAIKSNYRQYFKCRELVQSIKEIRFCNLYELSTLISKQNPEYDFNKYFPFKENEVIELHFVVAINKNNEVIAFNCYINRFKHIRYSRFEGLNKLISKKYFREVIPLTHTQNSMIKLLLNFYLNNYNKINEVNNFDYDNEIKLLSFPYNINTEKAFNINKDIEYILYDWLDLILLNYEEVKDDYCVTTDLLKKAFLTEMKYQLLKNKVNLFRSEVIDLRDNEVCKKLFDFKFYFDKKTIDNLTECDFNNKPTTKAFKLSMLRMSELVYDENKHKNYNIEPIMDDHSMGLRILPKKYWYLHCEELN